jgi:hypothetical protein
VSHALEKEENINDLNVETLNIETRTLNKETKLHASVSNSDLKHLELAIPVRLSLLPRFNLITAAGKYPESEFVVTESTGRESPG